MDTTFVQLSPVALAMVPLVMACVSLLKMYTGSYWSPLISVALGVAGAFLLPGLSATAAIVSGLMIGLTAAGLYSGGSKMIQG